MTLSRELTYLNPMAVPVAGVIPLGSSCQRAMNEADQDHASYFLIEN